MNEQATSSVQIATSTDNLKVQSEQTARALAEQARAVKDINSATQNVSKQIKLITDANRIHSDGARALAENLHSAREVVVTNLADAKSMHAASTRLQSREISSGNGTHAVSARKSRQGRSPGRVGAGKKSSATKKSRPARKGR
jgi:methyl-accepting chemotaxis protein